MFIVNQDCKCCQNFIHDMTICKQENWKQLLYHCEDCWNEHHNGLRDKDWENYDTYIKKRGLNEGLQEKNQETHISS